MGNAWEKLLQGPPTTGDVVVNYRKPLNDAHNESVVTSAAGQHELYSTKESNKSVVGDCSRRFVHFCVKFPIKVRESVGSVGGLAAEIRAYGKSTKPRNLTSSSGNPKASDVNRATQLADAPRPSEVTSN